MKTKILHTGLLTIMMAFFAHVTNAIPFIEDDYRTMFHADAIRFVETEIEIEKWMTETSAFSSHYEKFIDRDLMIEDWMTREFSDLIEPAGILMEDMEIEDWMTRRFEFEDSTGSFDRDIEIEPWMTKIMR